ncbi:O-methyltransferase [Mucilaginibacter myungsuensis]|uniref:Class I SAM-dependent methyltransferase n=1 Tax=Mucilaginibacter myungsuensis TaxID=649104 RepID=A0A929KZE8_9SPHI|nr:class I SAM-dependent methyltransferase [Mucilaginibacter myungsuensis]MBE9662768.1 class I SAM-dependent methyltransferase [Mucilaginibacter myungsuensis]MDN3598188.1 class I SAM-dependent methyltransferase [Mucilaginibacter myungsuensis]
MLNIRFATDFLLHRLSANTRHGVHSPFVYRLVDKVIYDFSDQKVYQPIEAARKKLLADDRSITVTDLGAGSHLNNNKTKQVSVIAKNALKSPRLAQLIYRLVADQQPKNIVELGTCLGITSLYLQQAAPEAKVYTLEGCPQTAAVAGEVFKQNGADNIEQIVGNFDDTLYPLLESTPKLDFIYVDGNHQKEATLRYFEWCLPRVHEGSLLIFDDIYWSQGMKEAWAQIKAHPDVTVTVDLFWIGLVYFKKGQVKEDFKIKF